MSRVDTSCRTFQPPYQVRAPNARGGSAGKRNFNGMPSALDLHSDGWLALHVGLLLGRALFFGLAYEEFYGDSLAHRPGGIRSYPLLALAGALLYLLAPASGWPFVIGMLVIAAWSAIYIAHTLRNVSDPAHSDALFVAPSAALLAYLLGAVTFVLPPWLVIGAIVVAALLLSARTRLRELAQHFGHGEVVTAAKFLVLSGVILPLLKNLPTIPGTDLHPFNIWLAVVAVSALSYASYIVQRYVAIRGGTLIPALLGGMYSSTAATVALARSAAEVGFSGELSGGIVAASAVMYLRILVVVAIFNISLAQRLAPAMIVLTLFGGVLAALIVRFGDRTKGGKEAPVATHPGNPLQLTTALIFAALFVLISLLTAWVQQSAGQVGLYVLAAVVGVTDIDPFVLGLAQHHAAAVALAPAAAAILIAASSNDVLKALYSYTFSRRRESWLAASALVLLAALGVAIALFAIR